MLKRILLLMFLSVFIHVSQAFPWGGVNYYWPSGQGAPTHQAILRGAYEILSNDPAFEEDKFFTLESILEYEGVDIYVSKGFKAVGQGPDADGATMYSFHYYNPAIDQGGAPDAVQDYFKELLGGKNLNKQKGAAWSAHFLADMSVPYHVVGMPRDTAIAYVRDKEQNLSEEFSGPLFLYGDSDLEEGWGSQHNFWEATQYYVKNHSDDMADWYDPWYSNGFPHSVAWSSHVVWEDRAHKLYAQNPPERTYGYNTTWENATVSKQQVTISRMVESQAVQAALFTKKAALHTRKWIENIYYNPVHGISNAITDVATLWRASITGLRPKLIVWPDRADDPSEYGIECRVKNSASDLAYNTQVKLFVHKKQGLYGVPVVESVGDIGSGQTASVKFWVKLPRGDYDIKVVVVAEYKIPDFQYATAMTKISSDHDSASAEDLSAQHCPERPSGPATTYYFPPDKDGENYFSCNYRLVFNPNGDGIGPWKHWLPWLYEYIDYRNNRKTRTISYYNNGNKHHEFIFNEDGSYKHIIYESESEKVKSCSKVNKEGHLTPCDSQ